MIDNIYGADPSKNLFPPAWTPGGKAQDKIRANDAELSDMVAALGDLLPLNLPEIRTVTDPEWCDHMDRLVVEWREAHRD